MSIFLPTMSVSWSDKCRSSPDLILYDGESITRHSSHPYQIISCKDNLWRGNYNMRTITSFASISRSASSVDLFLCIPFHAIASTYTVLITKINAKDISKKSLFCVHILAFEGHINLQLYWFARCFDNFPRVRLRV